jgi:hypothetical protein
MQNEQPNEEIGTSQRTVHRRRSLPVRWSAGSAGRHQRIRIALSLPRRRPCLIKRAMLAALCEAELAEWLASGGDFLGSMHQSTT